MSSIFDRVKKWARSPQGEARISKTIVDKRNSGDGRTGAGDYIITLQDMQWAAEELIHRLRLSAEGLPASVYNHFRSIDYSFPEPISKGNNEEYIIIFRFMDDLSRMSLKVTRKRDGVSYRTGNGIDDIVSLFETGYEPTKRVGGIWEGHEELGTIGSKASREGLHFMQQAIDDFNSDPEWGKKYHATALLIPSDEGVFTI